jgi:hypothetical protein
VKRGGRPQLYCSPLCRNRGNAKTGGSRQKRQKAPSNGAEASAEAESGASAARALDLSVAAERDAPGKGHDQGDGQGKVSAGARLVLDRGVVAALTDDLTIRSAGVEQRAAFGGCGEHDLTVDDLWPGVPLKGTPAASVPVLGHWMT